MMKLQCLANTAVITSFLTWAANAKRWPLADESEQQGASAKPATPTKRRGLLIGLGAIAATGLGASLYWPRRWRYIVIHHSAGASGTLEGLRQVHRERQARDPIDAIPYHYLIGNGRGIGLGEVIAGRRVENHLWGGHVNGRAPDLNFRGIGICLIGNYQEQQVPEQQYLALVSLTRKLMKKYSIKSEQVYTHGHAPKQSTLCPGKNFPRQRFHSDIGSAQKESV